MNNENTIHIDVDVVAALDEIHLLIRICDQLNEMIRDEQRRPAPQKQSEVNTQ